MPKLVLFDIDGTLLLTAGAGRRAITAALAEEVEATNGLPSATSLIARFERVRFDGKTDRQIVVELLAEAGHAGRVDQERVTAICRRYVRLLEAELRHPDARTTLMPGVTRLLDRLEEDDEVVLGLLTGNVVEGAALKLRSAGLDPARFVVGAYGSDSAHRPDLPPIAARRAAPFFGREPSGGEVVIIGDTPADIACGAALEARAIGVATGAYPFDELAACEPHAVFVDLADTDSVLEAILGD